MVNKDDHRNIKETCCFGDYLRFHVADDRTCSRKFTDNTITVLHTYCLHFVVVDTVVLYIPDVYIM